jgi:Fe-S-cluster containining protein
MLLSNRDIRLLERAGYDRKEFVRLDKQGFAKLRNHLGFCTFYNTKRHRCNVYRHRPLGCRIYPVFYIEDEGPALDNLCPMKSTVSERELERKAGELLGLLRRIDSQARKRRTRMSAVKRDI